MALGHLAPGSRGRCVRPNNLAALVEEEEEEESLFKADAVRGGLRARPRYPGVGDGTRRTTFPRATHPYLSKLLHSYLVR